MPRHSHNDGITVADNSDEIRFEKLFRENYLRLYRYALDWVEDEEQAKDIVGSLMSDLWSIRSNWHPDDETAYMFSALRNRCINHIKKRIRYNEVLEEYLEDKLRLIDEDIDVHEENLTRLNQMIESLPPKTRSIIELCYLEGKKYKDAAEQIGTTPGMVHKHISKALALFRKNFLTPKGTE